MLTTTTVAILAMAAMATRAPVAQASAAQQDAVKPPATVKDVMTTMTIPASDVIFAASSELPKTDEQWAALRQGAMTLAESGKLLMTSAFAKDRTAWMERAGEMVTRAEATLRVAQAKNSEALEQASNDVYETCEACHARYLPPGP